MTVKVSHVGLRVQDIWLNVLIGYVVDSAK